MAGAGLFAALHRADRAGAVTPFQDGAWEILSVYYKPAPACNYAQTACQAALVLAVQDGIRSTDIAEVRVKCSAAAVAYPGCNYAGPYDRILQGKMSIQYCVAATLAQGKLAESNYHLLNDPEVTRLVGLTTLETGDDFTSNYPAKQGAEVMLRLRNGETHTRTPRRCCAGDARRDPRAVPGGSPRPNGDRGVHRQAGGSAGCRGSRQVIGKGLTKYGPEDL